MKRTFEIHVRIATPDDAREISEVMREAFSEYESSYTTAAFVATTPTTDGVLLRIAEGPVWVACRGRGIVGTVSVVPHDDGLYLRGMAALPRARGLGVGRALLGAVEAFAAAQGQRRIFLCTTPFLVAAIRLYERAGFCRTAAGPFDLFGTPLFTMEKRVTR